MCWQAAVPGALVWGGGSLYSSACGTYHAVVPFGAWGIGVPLPMLQIRINYPTMPFQGQLFASVPLNKLLYDEQCLR